MADPDALSQAVDRVLTEQIERFVRVAEGGNAAAS
jgi:hypothetical protein